MKRKSMIRKVIWLLILLAVGAGGYFWWQTNQASQASKESLPAENTEAKDKSTPVTAVKVQHREVQRTVEAVGTLFGFEEVTISAKVEGRVKRLLHDVSDRVKPGELLFEIDPTDYELSVRQAEKSLQVETARMGVEEPPGPGFDLKKLPPVMQASVKLENARLKLDRLQSAGAAATREDLSDREADLRIAEAEYQNQILQMRSIWATVRMKQESLAMSRQQLKDTQIFSPTPSMTVPQVNQGFTYVITHRPVAEGTFVRVGTELCKLAIDQSLKLRLPVPERFLSEVKQGQKTVLSTAAYPRSFDGIVTRINPSIETQTRTFEVEVQIPNKEGLLRPGGFARAEIQTHTDPQAAVVPISALVTFAGVTKILLMEDGKVKVVPVTVGVQTSEWVEIATPAIPKNAMVITSGQTALTEGSPVRLRQK